MCARGQRVSAAAIAIVLAGLLVSAGPHLASAAGFAPPTIVSLVVHVLGPTSATAVGEVNPNGTPTTVYFRVGVTSPSGSKIALQGAGSARSPVMVIGQMGALRPATSYHLELDAMNEGGPVSAEVSFATPARAANAAPIPGELPPAPGGNAVRVRALQVTDVPHAATALNAVSCASTTFCLAVGATYHSPAGAVRPIVEQWGGRGFHLVASPSAADAELLGISCTTAEFCLAVGRSGENAFSERWNGHGWRVEPTPSPRIIGSDLLEAVSCVTPSNCWAIGGENSGTVDARVMTEHWNGATWSLAASPAPPESLVTSLDCVSATSCWAVGIKDTQRGMGSPFVEHWTGRAWVLSATPALKGQLFSVSCGAPTSCFATGILLGTGLLLHLTGSTWHETPVAMHAEFDALSCWSASDCVAGQSATAHWNGHAWALGAAAAATGGSAGASIASISCPKPSECFAVGTVGAQAITQALADQLTW